MHQAHREDGAKQSTSRERNFRRSQIAVDLKNSIVHEDIPSGCLQGTTEPLVYDLPARDTLAGPPESGKFFLYYSLRESTFLGKMLSLREIGLWTKNLDASKGRVSSEGASAQCSRVQGDGSNANALQ
jgi:hypothetical protein